MAKKEYEVFNFGPSRSIPYKGGSLNLQQHWGFITSDRRLVKILKEFQAVSIRELGKTSSEYDHMNFFKLKQKARDMGLKIDSKVKKKELIKLMEGVK